MTDTDQASSMTGGLDIHFDSHKEELEKARHQEVQQAEGDDLQVRGSVGAASTTNVKVVDDIKPVVPYCLLLKYKARNCLCAHRSYI